MERCPACEASLISRWQASLATSRSPARCPSCGALSYVPDWRHAIAYLFVEVAFWATIVLALWLRSWSALLAFPLLWLAWIALVPRQFELRTTDAAAVAVAQRRGIYWMLAIVATILVFALLTSRA